MSDQIEKAVVLASKISAKAEDTLSGVEREMRIMKWPDEFRAIMWEAIADAASIRARQARHT
jgi:hypothetical protein